jgi:hypothetical protein
MLNDLDGRLAKSTRFTSADACLKNKDCTEGKLLSDPMIRSQEAFMIVMYSTTWFKNVKNARYPGNNRTF